jgi:hypothetical protein
LIIKKHNGNDFDTTNATLRKSMVGIGTSSKASEKPNKLAETLSNERQRHIGALMMVSFQ